MRLIPKSNKDTEKQKNHKNYRPTFLMNINEKFLSKILANQIQKYVKRIRCHDQVEFTPVMQGCNIRMVQRKKINHAILTKERGKKKKKQPDHLN